MTYPSQHLLGKQTTLVDLEGDVHLLMHKFREAEPVSFVHSINAWLVTRHDDCCLVMRDTETYTVDHPGFTTAQVIGPTMLSFDGQLHKQHRRPFEAPFRKTAIKESFDRKVNKHINALIDKFEELDGTELMKSFAGPISVLTMQSALGMENVSISHALSFNNSIIDTVTALTAGKPKDHIGSEAFSAFRDSLTPELNSDPNTSLLASAHANPGDLNDDQLLSNAALLLIGGIETTEGMIGNALYHLLSDLDLLERIKSDTSLIPKLIEESLRLEPAAGVIDRFATKDVVLRGRTIKKGDLVRVSLSAANRDPNVFERPDKFDLSRTNLKSHVTFAQGPHVCLGLHLARLEAIKAIEIILKRIPKLRLNSEYSTRAKPKGLVFRKPDKLWVEW